MAYFNPAELMITHQQLEIQHLELQHFQTQYFYQQQFYYQSLIQLQNHPITFPVQQLNQQQDDPFFLPELREEQVNAYKNLAVDQAEALRRLNKDYSLLKFLRSGRVYGNQAQQCVNYHDQFPVIRPKYDNQQKTITDVKPQHRDISHLKVVEEELAPEPNVNDLKVVLKKRKNKKKVDISSHFYERHVPAIRPKYGKERNCQQKTDSSVKSQHDSTRTDKDCSKLWDNYDDQFPALT